MLTLYTHTRFWLGASIFAALTFILLSILYVIGGPLDGVDIWLGHVLHSVLDYDIIWLNWSMKGLSFFGDNGLLIVAMCTAIYLALHRSWAELFLWLVSVGGIIVFNRILKEYFETLRPMVGHMEVLEQSTGFPSGHAMIAVATYGLLAAVVATRVSGSATRVASMLMAIVLVGLISFSRLFLTVHYLSDVLGGLAAGIWWLGASIYVFNKVPSIRAKRADYADAANEASQVEA
jgi:undecaprenyl-diphosphatase